ncbi:hypothetical protein NDU88_004829 [Pleurodeles waltl]|uniref:Secreted protein n=1 Tax=Pleurodeles waltl TaxID=8319 RepID=A0AAV7RKB5_PLEWA|nr:hypothetical protein NDU88_004829 [Pleurodeles waltl]
MRAVWRLPAFSRGFLRTLPRTGVLVRRPRTGRRFTVGVRLFWCLFYHFWHLYSSRRRMTTVKRVFSHSAQK